MRHIGDVIRMVRTGRNLTQTKLSELCGCSDSYITHLEKGKRDPNWSFVQVLFREMGVDVSMALCLVDTPIDGGPVSIVSPMRSYAYTYIWDQIERGNKEESHV